jgi:cation-transporting P-type ATPase I
VSAPPVAAVRRAGQALQSFATRGGRHVWQRPRRAHIETRIPAAQAARLEKALEAISGVAWAGWNGPLGHVIVDFDEDATDLATLIAAVVELEHELRSEPDHAALAHPADDRRPAALIAEIGVDAVALTGSLWGQLLRWTPLPVELASAVTFIESQTGVRQFVERRVGRAVSDLGFAVTNAFAQGLAQGPTGLLVDIAHRADLLVEHRTRVRRWSELEEHSITCAEAARASALHADKRPVPRSVPAADLYAQRMARGALLGGGALALSGRSEIAGGVFTAGLSKAVRTSREAFAAELVRSLSGTGAAVCNPDSVRLLEQIDVVVVEGPVDPELRRTAEDASIALITPASGRLRDAVRRFQEAGHVVAAFTSDPATLAAADLGVARVHADRLAWHADLLLLDEQLPLLVGAVVAARDAARRSVALAATGSAAGAVLACVPGPRRSAHVAASLVNLAAVAGAISGHRDAQRLCEHARSTSRRAQPPWHALAVDDVLARVASSGRGLTESEAGQRRVESPECKEPSLGAHFVAELANPMTPVLGAGAAVSAALGSLVDAALVGGALAGNALLGAIQQRQTDRAIRQLDGTNDDPIRVWRDRAEVEVRRGDLVVGDVVCLAPGDVVPADARVLEARGAVVDEAGLTGESFPVTKTSRPDGEATFVADHRSMLHAGTTIVAGEPVAVVVAVGEDTEAAAALAVERTSRAMSGVEQRLADIARVTVPVTIGSAGFLSLNALLRGRQLRETLTSAVGLIAAALPEGLPIAATTAQLAAARRLSTHNAMVRTPRALEALGRVDILCFDKTGTLTEGEVVVHGVATGAGLEPVTHLSPSARLALAAAVRATGLATENGNGRGNGNGHARVHSADRAIAEAAKSARLDGDWSVAAELPFEHDRSFHAIRSVDTQGWSVSVKGAPETLLPRCTWWRRGGARVPLDGELRATANQQAAHLAGEGYRVLAIARRSASSRPELADDDIRGLELLGFIALADQVRETAREAVKGLRRAGVDVAMITGDHPETASTVASSVGTGEGRVLSGAQLDELSDDELATVVEGVTVFARVTPSHKARIVDALQRRGRVVAMTGDGTNDAAAIRLADAGLALGRRATPAARQVADVVITDDRLETILDAIIEGRAMWAAVRDAIAMLVGGNFGELGFAVVVGGLTGASPLNARQTLLVNLLTDMLPAAAIASRPPRNVTPESLIDSGPHLVLGDVLRESIATRAVITGGAASASWLLARVTGRRRHADTVGLVSLVTSQLGQTLVASRLNPPVVVATAGSLVALVGAVQLPGVSRFFGCTPLGPVGWTIGVSSGVVATGVASVAPRVRSVVARSGRPDQRHDVFAEEPLDEDQRQLGKEQRNQFLHGDLRRRTVRGQITHSSSQSA